MHSNLTFGEFLAGLLLAAVIVTVSCAANQDETRELSALQSAKVDLIDAIRIAEQRTGGHAHEADVNVKGGNPRIVVETNGPSGIQTVAIDTRSGLVISTFAGAERD